MPTNEAEQYLNDLAERSFLKLWTVSNPFKKAGKELTDLLVAFGNDLIIFSDKASEFGGAFAWQRWRRRTIDGSLKQLKGAVRSIESSSGVYLDNRASEGLPFRLPAAADQRLHLVAIARPSLDPRRVPADWNSLSYDTDAGSSPFKIGPAYVGTRFVHIFDGEAIEFLLTQLDTAPDFLAYLKSREFALRNSKRLTFTEKDLFATAVDSWTHGDEFTVQLPLPDASGRIDLRPGLWEDHVASEGATLTKGAYANSKNIDLLINHFHLEYAADRFLGVPRPSYELHEKAMRLLAGETRFARRMIADGLVELLREDDNTTFWASTVPSPHSPTIRYVWLTYPELPDALELSEYEQLILHHLRQHLLVARLTFGAATFVGIAVPNSRIKMLSHFICILDGETWSEDNEAEAQHWKAQGVFDNLTATHRLYTP